MMRQTTTRRYPKIPPGPPGETAIQRFRRWEKWRQKYGREESWETEKTLYLHGLAEQEYKAQVGLDPSSTVEIPYGTLMGYDQTRRIRPAPKKTAPSAPSMVAPQAHRPASQVGFTPGAMSRGMYGLDVAGMVTPYQAPDWAGNPLVRAAYGQEQASGLTPDPMRYWAEWTMLPAAGRAATRVLGAYLMAGAAAVGSPDIAYSAEQTLGLRDPWMQQLIDFAIAIPVAGQIGRVAGRVGRKAVAGVAEKAALTVLGRTAEEVSGKAIIDREFYGLFDKGAFGLQADPQAALAWAIDSYSSTPTWFRSRYPQAYKYLNKIAAYNKPVRPLYTEPRRVSPRALTVPGRATPEVVVQGGGVVTAGAGIPLSQSDDPRIRKLGYTMMGLGTGALLGPGVLQATQAGARWSALKTGIQEWGRKSPVTRVISTVGARLDRLGKRPYTPETPWTQRSAGAEINAMINRADRLRDQHIGMWTDKLLEVAPDWKKLSALEISDAIRAAHGRMPKTSLSQSGERFTSFLGEYANSTRTLLEARGLIGKGTKAKVLEHYGIQHVHPPDLFTKEGMASVRKWINSDPSLLDTFAARFPKKPQETATQYVDRMLSELQRRRPRVGRISRRFENPRKDVPLWYGDDLRLNYLMWLYYEKGMTVERAFAVASRQYKSEVGHAIGIMFEDHGMGIGWGGTFGRLPSQNPNVKKLLGEIAKKDSTADAEWTAQMINASQGIQPWRSEATGKFVSGLMGLQTVRKIGPFTALKQFGQSFFAYTRPGMKASKVFKAQFDTYSDLVRRVAKGQRQPTERFALQSGATVRQTMERMAEAMTGAQGKWSQFHVNITAVKPADMIQRSIAANAGREAVIDVAEQFARNPKSLKLRRVLERTFGLDPEQVLRVGGELTEEQLRTAGWTLSKDTQYLSRIPDLPEMVRTNDVVRMATQFRTFAMQTASMISKNMVESFEMGAVDGFASIAKLLLYAGVPNWAVEKSIDELYDVVRGGEYRRELSRTALQTVIDEVAMVGAMGFYMDAMRSLLWEDETRAAVGFFGGPTGSDIADLTAIGSATVKGVIQKAAGEPVQAEQEFDRALRKLTQVAGGAAPLGLIGAQRAIIQRYQVPGRVLVKDKALQEFYAVYDTVERVERSAKELLRKSQRPEFSAYIQSHINTAGLSSYDRKRLTKFKSAIDELFREVEALQEKPKTKHAYQRLLNQEPTGDDKALSSAVRKVMLRKRERQIHNLAEKAIEGLRSGRETSQE